MSGLVEGKATPRGAYPHIRRAGDFLFVSGTSSRLADNSFAGVNQIDEMGTMHLDVREQTRAVLENMKDYLATEGATMADVVDVTSFLVNMNDFAGYNEVYGEYFMLLVNSIKLFPVFPKRIHHIIHQIIV